MLRIFFAGLICIVVFFISLTYIPIYLLLFFNKKLQNKYLWLITSSWGWLIVSLTGSKVLIEGKENIPEEGSFLFIGNHQSHVDIPVLLGFLPKTKGFIAKKELTLVPFINFWIPNLGGAFIDRKNIRKSIEEVDKIIKSLNNRYTSLVLFPEGHRSQGSPMKHFKPGSIKLAVRENVNIIPFSIEGTYKILEGYNKKAEKNPNIKLTVHKPIYTANLTETEKNNIVNILEDTVSSGLSDKYKLKKE